MAYVYWIRKPEHNNICDEGYVGFTSKTDVNKRFSEHMANANTRLTRCRRLGNAIKKYGRAALVFEVICVGTVEYCLWLETQLRPMHGIGWNLAIGGDKPAIGRIVSEDTRKKLSISSSRLVMSTEARAKISAKAMGNKRTLGRKVSEETKVKLRAANLGKIYSDDVRAKLSAMRKGWKPPPESIERGRLKRIGSKHTAESREKMSISAKERCLRLGPPRHRFAGIVPVVRFKED